MTNPWPYVRYNGNDVHKNWIDLGWFRVRLDDHQALRAKRREVARRKREDAAKAYAAAEEARKRDRRTQEAQRRALGLRWQVVR